MFDVTHGINFMQSIALHLARAIASLTAIRQIGKNNKAGITIEVINSDPYPPTPRKVYNETCREIENNILELNLNIVYKEIVSNIHIPHTIPSNIVKQRENIQDAGFREDLDEYEKYLDQARYVASSLYYPLPLPLIYSCYEFLSSHNDKILNNILETWTKKINIVASTARVERRVELYVNSIYAILPSLFACKSVEKLIDGLNPPLEPVSVESLRKLADLYNMISEVHGHLVTYEPDMFRVVKNHCKEARRKIKKIGGEQCITLRKK